MAWRGATSTKDKIFAALVYSVPLYYSMRFGSSVFQFFPKILLTIINIFLIPLNFIYSSLPFADLVLFFVLFLAVVRNDRLSHFIRFNTMQALLIDIGLFLISMAVSILGLGIISNIISSVVFLVALAICLYSIIQSAQGLYPDIPSISQAAYTQVP